MHPGEDDGTARIGALGFTDDPGRPATPEERATMARDLAPVDGVGRIDATTRIVILTLPFHPAADLVVAQDPAWAPAGVLACWLRHGAAFRRLDGSARPIHELNAAAAPAIDGATALPYLRFFCFFVRGAEGPFLVLGQGSRAVLPPELHPLIADRVPEAEFLGADRHGTWHLAAMLLYGTRLFAARFTVSASGQTDMLKDDPVHEDLPAGVEAPLTLTGSGTG